MIGTAFKFRQKIKNSMSCPCSLKNFEFGHLTLLFCRVPGRSPTEDPIGSTCNRILHVYFKIL